MTDPFPDVDKTLEAVRLCSDAAGKRKGVFGVVECPRCKGKLHWRTARSNGHIHACCDTLNCTEFIQ